MNMSSGDYVSLALGALIGYYVVKHFVRTGKAA